MDLQDKYKDFEKRIKFNENIINQDNQSIENLSNNIEALSNNLNTSLESFNISLNELKNSYGTSIEDITNSANQCAFEPVYYFGGQDKFNVGSKASLGPFATLFTRVSPVSQFSGVIRLYMSDIPATVTQTTLNFYINNNLTQLTSNIITEQPYNIEINFDFLVLTTSNVFKIEFSDSRLENTVLDFIEIISTNGRNFMCLNRHNEFNVSTFMNGTGRISYIYARQISNVGEFVEMFVERTSPPFGTLCKIPGQGTTLNVNIMHNHLRKRVSVGSYDSSIIQLSVAGENSTLYRTQNNITTYSQFFDGVYSAFISYHWRTNYKCYCGTTLNQQVFIGDENTLTINDIPTINSMPLPNEFITCTPIEDLKFMLRGVNKEIGYILLHNSGKIFYIQEDDGTYFIEIGLGSQPTAYMQSDYETIFIYYTFNKTTYRKELKFNHTTNKWELTKNVLIYPATIEVLDLNEGCQIRTDLDGARQIFTI